MAINIDFTSFKRAIVNNEDNIMKLPITVFMCLLFVTSAYAGGGYGCRIPVEKFSGDYEIILLTEQNDPEINELVKETLNRVEKKRLDLFRNAQIEVRDVEFKNLDSSGKRLPETVTQNTSRVFLIGVGNVSSVRMMFDESGVENGVIVPSKDSATASDPKEREKLRKLGAEEYYGQMMKHAVYRGLLQLNGEEKPQVTEVTVDHILSVDLK